MACGGATNTTPTESIFVIPATGPLFYDNSNPKLDRNVYYGPTNALGNLSTNEFGDEISFAPAGKDGKRTLGYIRFEYWLPRYLSGRETVRWRLYANSGPKNADGLATPGVQLFDSGPISLQERGGFNTLVITGLSLENLPDTVTWTVQFAGFSEGARGGLMSHGPPTMGHSFDDFWEKESEVWVTKRFAVGDEPIADFGFQAYSTPEGVPPTIFIVPGRMWGVTGTP